MVRRAIADSNPNWWGGDEPVAHLGRVSAAVYEADATTTPATTAWTAGTGATDVDNGDVILLLVWTTDSSLATPSGWTAGGSASANSWYLYAYTKTAGASEANVSVATTGNLPAFVEAYATRDEPITVDSIQFQYQSNPWYYGFAGNYYQPSVDGQGTSVEWSCLHVVRGPNATFYFDSTRPEEMLAESGPVGSSYFGGMEHPKPNDSDDQFRVDRYGSSGNPGWMYAGQIGLTFGDPSTTDSEVAAIALQSAYTPDGDGVSEVAAIALQVIYAYNPPDLGFTGWGIPWQ